MARHDPYKTDRKAHDKERVDKFLGRKSGGRVKDNDEGTNIHIEINAEKPGQGAEDTMAPPQAGPIPPPPPMMPPPSPPGPGGPPMGGGGPLGLKRGGAAKKQVGGALVQPVQAGLGGEPITTVKRGGAVKKAVGGPMVGMAQRPPGNSGVARANAPGQVKKIFAPPKSGVPTPSRNPAASTLPPNNPIIRKDGGGVKQAKASTMDAGAGSGEGRLEKIGKRP